MPWIGGAVAGVGSLVGGILGSNAADKAAQEQAQTARQALAFQQGVYNTAQGNLTPFINSGNTALSSLMGLLGLGGSGQNATAQSAFQAFTQNPSYQFPLQQGNLALNRQLAAAGLTGSGGALKAGINYNQGYASQGLNSYLAQLAALAGGGQQAASSLGSLGNTASGTSLNALLAEGGAQGAGTVASSNALGQGFNNALGALTARGPGNTPSALQSLGSSVGSWFGSSSYSPDQLAYNAATSPLNQPGSYGPGFG